MITSTSNQKIRNVKSLLSSKKERRRQQAYVIEGIKLFEEAEPDNIKETFVSESFLNKLKQEAGSLGHRNNKGSDGLNNKNLGYIYDKLENIGYETVSDTVFSKMSDTITPQGILCVIKSLERKTGEICESTDSVHMIVLEGLQDPGNLGTILRTAEAAGFDCIIADNATADVYSPKVIRSTMGAIFRVPVFYTDNLSDELDYLHQCGITIYAAHLKADKSYRDIHYSDRCAILIGNEGNGLSEQITDKADVLVKIHMHGKAESLNAAVAASLLMYEVNI